MTQKINLNEPGALVVSRQKPFLDILISVIVAVIVAVSTVYTTFATKKDVETMVHEKHNTVQFMLGQVLLKLDQIDQRVWELQKGKK